MSKRNGYYPQASRAAAGGYVWAIAWMEDREGRRGQGLLLVPDDPTEESSPVEVSDNLFAEFSRLEVCGETVQQFANESGWLGVATSGHPVVRSVPEEAGTILSGMNLKFGEQATLVGERLEDWASEVQSMRRAVDLANALEEKGLHQIDSWVRIEPPLIRYNDKGFGDDASSGASEAVLAPDVEEGQIRKAGRRILQTMINRELKKRTQIVVDLEGELSQQRVIANSLLGIMWLQFLDAVTKGTMGSCVVCSGLLVLAPRSGRTHRNNRKTCSNACRQKLRRKNLAERA